MSAETMAAAERVAKMLPDFVVDEKDTEPSFWAAALKHKTIEGAGLHVDIRDKKKWKFSCKWPFYRGESYCPDDSISATISISRTDEQIAKDLTRRVVEPYLKEFTVQVAKKQEAIDRHNQLTNVIGDFIVLLGANERADSDRQQISPYRHGVDELRFLHDGSKVQVKTAYLPTEVAKELCEFLKTRMPK